MLVLRYPWLLVHRNSCFLLSRSLFKFTKRLSTNYVKQWGEWGVGRSVMLGHNGKGIEVLWRGETGLKIALRNFWMTPNLIMNPF